MITVSYDCRNNSSIENVPEYQCRNFEDFPEWDKIKVYDRSNSNRKQLYYENKYVCSCSSEEANDIKNFIVRGLSDGVSIETIRRFI